MKKKTPPYVKPKSNPVSAKQNAFFLNAVLETYGLPIFIILLMALLLILFNKYVFFDKLMLYKDIGSDSINYSWPELYHYSKIIRSLHVPKWTFNWGLGQNDFPANLSDIPGWLMYTVNPANITYTFVYVEMLKMFFSGLFFFLFLRKINVTIYTAIIGAMLFTFSGFMTIGATWFAFTIQGCYLAFLLYSVELLRKDNNLLVFPIAIALISATNPMYIYLDGLFLISYLTVSFILNGLPRSTWQFLTKITLLGFLGVLISSLLLIAKTYQIEESPRGSGNVSITHILSSIPPFSFSEPVYYFSFVLRMLGNDMAGYANSFKGWNNYLESPMQYCGLISLLLLPQLFILANKKLKLVAAGVLAVAIFPMVFIYFRCAIWLFTGTYLRTISLFFDIVQIILALKALDLIIRRNKISPLLLLLTIVVISFIMFGPGISNSSLYLTVFLFLIFEALLIYFIANSFFYQGALLLLPLVVFAEIITLSWDTINTRDTVTKDELHQKTGYNDYTIEAVQHIGGIDKSFYRINKDYNSGASSVQSINDAMIQNFYSCPSYNSFNSKYYTHFQQKMKIIDDTIETHWLQPLIYHPLLMQLVGGKYMLLTDTTHNPERYKLDVTDTIHSIKICRSRYFLPLGFAYDYCISETEMAKIKVLKDVMILKAVVVHDSLINTDFHDMKRVIASDTAPFFMAKFSTIDSTLVNNLKKDSLHITHFSDNHITGDITTEDKKLFFLSIPYDKGWTLKVDGYKAKILVVNYGFIGCMLTKGNHKIDLSFEPVYYKAGIELSAAGILCYIGLAVVVFIIRRRKKANS